MEFDYAGTQACKAMREKGIISVLVNSKPATIMTGEGIADVVYIEPFTVGLGQDRGYIKSGCRYPQGVWC